MQKFFLVLFVALFTFSASGQNLDFTAPNMEGKVVTLSEYRGKVVVLNLWFINCPNCLSEIKMLNQLVAEYRDNKDVVFIAPAASTKRNIEAFLKKHPFQYQIIPDASLLIISKFGIPDEAGNIVIPFPMHYVLDREGNVVVKVEGTKGIAVVQAELKRQLAPKAATVKASK